MEELIEYYKKLIKERKGNDETLRIFEETLEILEAKYEEECYDIPDGYILTKWDIDNQPLTLSFSNQYLKGDFLKNVNEWREPEEPLTIPFGTNEE